MNIQKKSGFTVPGIQKAQVKNPQEVYLSRRQQQQQRRD